MSDLHVRAADPGDRADGAALTSLRRAWADEEAGEQSRPFDARAGFGSADELLVLPLVRATPPD